mmetsp:Transcript_43973/g.131828  ORF Transcript_43973/g.131828 Transcript_43973/m.131828 type:complete len:497 (-) Transcript_43973:323-1813(-)
MATQGCSVHDNVRGNTKKGSLARAVEQREMVRRAQEMQRNEIQKFYGNNNVLEHIEKSTLLDDLKRREREAKERSAEANMLDTMYQSERARELNRLRAEEEERLALALSKQQREQERKAAELQQLRGQSEELRALSEKIRIARINRARHEQLQEKEAIRAQEREYDATLHRYVDDVDRAAEAKLVEHEARRREQAVAARMVLEEQMQEKHDALAAAEAEFLRERAMVDEVVARIAQEDALDAAARVRKVAETKALIAQFQLDKVAERDARAAAAAAEDRKIAEHWEGVRAREAAEAAKKAAAREVADRMYEQVKAEMQADRAARDEEERLINLLRLEEMEEKRRQEELAKRAQAEALRAEIFAANEEQKRIKIAREAQYAAEEAAYRVELMARFAEQDRLEQLNAQKRRMKLAEHQRAVSDMIDDKRRRYMEQKARDEAEAEAVRAADERKLALIEDERRKLLIEAAELREYLPRGVIRDQADLALINRLQAAARQ